MNHAPLSSLPVPEPGAIEHSKRLIEVIKNEIQNNNGMIPFNRFMEMALYLPGLGYYSAGAHKFGQFGDFTTAPQISSLFSRCVARQCRQVLNECGTGQILEVGAGTGTMAAHILQELARFDSLPTHYLILELSAELRHRQAQTFAREIPHLQSLVKWIDDWPEPGFVGCIVANEVLDAFPVHRFTIKKQQTREINVGLTDDKLSVCNATTDNEMISRYIDKLQLPEDYTSEINLLANAWIRSLSDFFTQGVILLVDYGYTQSEYYHAQRSHGTLMCHFRHFCHSDPFLYPGLQDITAHVDFSAIATAAENTPLNLAGFTTQAHFLLANGLQELLTDFQSQDSITQFRLSQEVKKLTLPNEMGEIFKVLAFSRDIDQDLQGFALNDMRHRL